MRPLHLLVVLETVLLAVVAVFWGLRSGEGGPVVVGTEQARNSDAGSVPRRAEGAAAGNGEELAGSGASERVEVSAGEHAEVVVLVQGRVLDENGSELAEEIGVVFRRIGDVRRATCVGPRYAATNLRPGVWTVDYSAEGFVPGRVEVELSTEAVRTVDLELTRAWRLELFVEGAGGVDLEEVLRELGISVALAAVATNAPVVGDSVALGSSDRRLRGVGRFEVKGDSALRPSEHGEAGVFWLDHPPPVHVTLLLHHSVIARQAVPAGAREVRFVVDPEDLRQRVGRIVMRLIDGATGKPIEDQVYIMRGVAGVSGTARTERDGDRLVIPHILPGVVNLRIQAGKGGKGREIPQFDVLVPDGGTLDLGDVILHPSTVLHGRLLDAEGEPSSGQILWGEASGERPTRGVARPMVTFADGDGRFSIHHLRPLRYVVVGRGAKGGFAHAAVDPAATSKERPLEMTLTPVSRVSIVPEPPDGEAWRATARDGDGVVVWEEWLRGGPREREIWLGAGRWQIEVATHEGVSLLREDVDLGAGLPKILEVVR